MRIAFTWALRIELQPDLLAEVIEMSPGGERVLRFNQPIEPRLPALGVTAAAAVHSRAVARSRTLPDDLLAHAGSAAAPTAGLHFTPRLIDQLA